LVLIFSSLTLTLGKARRDRAFCVVQFKSNFFNPL
jgi:hypothetical protein